MPAAERLHCILCSRDLEMLAFVFGLCRWSANFGRFLVVFFYQIVRYCSNKHTRTAYCSDCVSEAGPEKLIYFHFAGFVVGVFSNVGNPLETGAGAVS
jgi:hypothetical protein